MMTASLIRDFQTKGFCMLRARLPLHLIHSCRDAFWPILTEYLGIYHAQPNRGPNRHFLPMPFDKPCFRPEFFFDAEIMNVVRGLMDDRVVADQWGCDVPLRGSEYQEFHADYQRPLFPELPDLQLPTYMAVVSFGLVPISASDGPVEIALGTHRLARKEALRAVETSEVAVEPVLMNLGDVLIRHPWALHRGSPNLTETPRALVSIRYVRRWYADASREVNGIPHAVWASLTAEQQLAMRFPFAEQ